MPVYMSLQGSSSALQKYNGFSTTNKAEYLKGRCGKQGH